MYGLAADPNHSGAVLGLAAVKGRPADQPFTYHLATIEDLPRVAAPPPQRVHRLLERVWPGPLTAILPAVKGPGDVGVRVPAHPFTSSVLAEFGTGLFMTSANRSGEPPLLGPDALAQAFADDPRIGILADAGPPILGEPSAIVRLRDRKLEIVRPGILQADEMLTGAAAKVLFVCSGNTCRSPLAEVLARKLVAQRLEIGTGDVLAHGLCFLSAGTGTLDGMPASGGSLEAAQESDMSLEEHRSASLSRERIDEADRIYCLSPSHVADVIAIGDAEASAKTSLLHTDDEGISDPFGGPIEVYRETRNEIETHLRRRMDEILELGG